MAKLEKSKTETQAKIDSIREHTDKEKHINAEVDKQKEMNKNLKESLTNIKNHNCKDIKATTNTYFKKDRAFKHTAIKKEDRDNLLNLIKKYDESFATVSEGIDAIATKLEV